MEPLVEVAGVEVERVEPLVEVAGVGVERAVAVLHGWSQSCDARNYRVAS